MIIVKSHFSRNPLLVPDAIRVVGSRNSSSQRKVLQTIHHSCNNNNDNNKSKSINNIDLIYRESFIQRYSLSAVLMPLIAQS